ncbi:Proprotein convertase P [Shewanella halifaxensis HAW-EB4]|uniref:Proprotein convertase P n=1 Tax=Shewanella halifaxensis (strain HAW-EB4) TaxID=458817 RepID=B0TK61_SHEHH|nr:Ig-like domain-containing protein [Shewanella halifaxensis]ABZ77080.1 Proprotein convertase P [Shewanella halifaxensis HAW-EB4]
MRITKYILVAILLLLSFLSEATTPLQPLRINKDAMVSNGEFSTSFYVPNSESITVIIPNIEGFQTSAINIISPDNEVITESNAALYGVDIIEFSPVTSEEHFIALTNSWIVEITDAKAGRYTIKGLTTSLHPKIPVSVQVNDSNILFHLTIGESSVNPTVNRFMPITVFLVENGLPQSQSSVTIEVSKDGVVLQQDTVLDNGIYPDYSTNDGLYSTLFKPLSTGIYNLSVHITGINGNGEEFEANVASRFKVSVENIYIKDTYTEEVSDKDGDGYSDELILNFDTGGEFPATGRFTYSVTLGLGDEGNLVHYGSIDASENKIYAKIDGEKIRSFNYSGEFKIKNLAIEYGDQYIQWSGSLANTAFYDNDSWERDDILYLGNVTFDPIDSADNRFIDMIDVSFDVDSLLSAKFGYSATITSVSGENVGVYGNQSIDLIQGINTVTFSIPSSNFAKLQSNTALKIKYLLMYPLIKGGNVIDKSKVATSLPYSCWDFSGCSGADNSIPVTVDDDVISTGKAMYIHVAQNDLDDDGDLLKVNSLTSAQHGVAEIVGNSIQYTPTIGFEGDDVFQYEIIDLNPKNNIWKGGVALGTVRVNVKPNHEPIANADTYHVPEGVTTYFKVLDNDLDVDGDGLYISSYSEPMHGTVINYGNQLGYTPTQGYVGADNFTYTIIDFNVTTNVTKGGSATSQVSIQIGNIINQEPVAMNDSYSLTPGTQSTLDVLQNDSDLDNDSLRISGYSLPAKGIIDVTDKLITYNANIDANGTDSFAYSIADGKGGSGTAIVTITFVLENNPVVAVSDRFEVPKNTSLAINVLSNDYDIEGDSYNIARFTQPFNGSVVRGLAEELIYTPDTDFIGDDDFSYTIQDVQGNLATALVRLTVFNDQPLIIANDDTVKLFINTSVGIDVLSNDTIESTGSLSIANFSQPTNGFVTLSNNKLTYIPNTDFNGTDEFSYSITDGLGNSDSATVFVSVDSINSSPTAVQDVAYTQVGTSVSVDVLSNDYDIDIEPIKLISFERGLYGSTQLSGNNIVYQPEDGFVGKDTFTYLISDPSGAESEGIVTVSVLDNNEAPLPQDDFIEVYQGRSIIYDVLLNDVDPNGDFLYLSSVSEPVNGSAVIEDNKIKYTASVDFVGNIEVSYVVSDGKFTSSCKLTVSVLPAPNTAPIIEIVNPIDGQHFSYGSSIHLIGKAWDEEDGELSDNILWHSNIDGGLGIGERKEVLLSSGLHTITGTIIDNDQLTSSMSVSITVEQLSGQTYSNSTEHNIPDHKGYGVASSITVPVDIYSTTARVTAKISHPMLTDIAIQLISPTGKHYKLVNPGRYISNENWKIDLTKLETSKGVWVLKVNDQKKGNLGTLKQWSIQFN